MKRSTLLVALATFLVGVPTAYSADESYPFFVYNYTLLAEYPYLGDGRAPVYPPAWAPSVTEYSYGTSAEWNAGWVPPAHFPTVTFDILDWFNYSAWQYANQYLQYENMVVSLKEKAPATKATLPHYGNPMNPTWDGYVFGYNAFQAPGIIGAMWTVHNMTKSLAGVQSFGQSSISTNWNGTQEQGYHFDTWATRLLQETSGANASCAYLTTSHDVGFCTLLPNLLGYRVSGNASLLAPLNAAAFRLAGRFLAEAGVTQSWTGSAYSSRSWTIIDNMMNIELLFWAAQFYQNQTWMDMAFSHANRTMYEAFRLDNSTYHVVEYNFTDGFAQKKHTRQGYSDSSTWARGQAWSIYGFTHAYRYTKYQPFLDKAIGAANLMLQRMAEQGTNDSVPYWDFDAPLTLSTADTPLSKCKPIANTTVGWRDTSAGSILASALLELVTFTDNQPDIQLNYWNQARYILQNLTTWQWSTRNHSDYSLPSVIAFGTSNWPTCLVNHSLSYGEHFFQEAMHRMWVFQQNQANAPRSLSSSTGVAQPSSSSTGSAGHPLPVNSVEVTFQLYTTSNPSITFTESLMADIATFYSNVYPRSAGVSAWDVGNQLEWGGYISNNTNNDLHHRRLLSQSQSLTQATYYVFGTISNLGGSRYSQSAYSLAQRFAWSVQNGTFPTGYSNANVPKTQTVIFKFTNVTNAAAGIYGGLTITMLAVAVLAVMLL